MSHTTRINSVRVTDLNALEAAVQRLAARGKNVSFERNAPCRLWFNSEQCDAVVKVHDCRFDVGFKSNGDGTYSPVFDAHGNLLYEHVGGGMEIAKTEDERKMAVIGGLMQAYGIEAVSRAAGEMNAIMDMHENAETGEVVMLVA